MYKSVSKFVLFVWHRLHFKLAIRLCIYCFFENIFDPFLLFFGKFRTILTLQCAQYSAFLRISISFFYFFFFNNFNQNNKLIRPTSFVSSWFILLLYTRITTNICYSIENIRRGNVRRFIVQIYGSIETCTKKRTIRPTTGGSNMNYVCMQILWRLKKNINYYYNIRTRACRFEGRRCD
jgi:hypothetical protein